MYHKNYWQIKSQSLAFLFIITFCFLYIKDHNHKFFGFFSLSVFLMKNIEWFLGWKFGVLHPIGNISTIYWQTWRKKPDKVWLWLNHSTIAVTWLIFVSFKEKNRSGWLIMYMRTQETSGQIVSDTVKPI